MQCAINPDNFNDVLLEIKKSKDMLFDFSGTNFHTLGHKQLTELFVALCGLPQAFTLKLNDCVMSGEHANPKVVDTLRLGFATTPKIETVELRRSISTPEVLVRVVEGLTRNPFVKNIHVDGFRLGQESAVIVIPPEVRHTLQKNLTAENILIDGLKVQGVDVRSNVSYASFYYHGAKNNVVMPDADLKQAVPSVVRRRSSS